MKKRTTYYLFRLIKRNPNNIMICKYEIICFLFSKNFYDIGIHILNLGYLHISLLNKKFYLHYNKKLF
jgi:hypothetical protein